MPKKRERERKRRLGMAREERREKRKTNYRKMGDTI